MQFIRYRSMRAEQRGARNKAQCCSSSSTSNQETDDDSVEDKQSLASSLSNFKLISLRFLITLVAFTNLMQYAYAREPRFATARVFTFLEQYHYPVIESTCNAYEESEMVTNSINLYNNIFAERYIIFQAIKIVIGDNAQIEFKCVENIESDNSDDSTNQYAGKFGSNEQFNLESDNYYISIPTLHFEKFYIQKTGLKSEASFSVFKYLNYLFYLGIFLIPAITGIILLFFKDLTTFYDYQRVVYSVFRYLNRQGDQQMNQWLHKCLSLTVAFFFFFYYSILLSEMTAQRRYNFSSTDLNRDSFKDIQNAQTQFNISNPIYFFLNVDSYQYHFLQEDYYINEDFLDPQINHYNVILNKNHFSEMEYNNIHKEILKYSYNHKSDNKIVQRKQFDNRSDDIYLNWIVLGVAFLTGLIFKLLQLRFSSLNSYTEIQSYRDEVNQNITLNYGELFRYYISQFLVNVQAKDHIQNFKQVPISKRCLLLGKQVYKVIEKRRKKMKFRRKRKYLQNQISTQNLSKQKLSLYQVIKEYLDLEKKGKGTVSTPRSTDSRRYAIQATLRANPFSTTNDQIFANNDQPKSFSSQVYSNPITSAHNKAAFKENQANSFNSLKVKPKESRYSIGGRLSGMNKMVGQSNFARRLSNLALSADIHDDTPKNQQNKALNNVLETIKTSNSKVSSPQSKKNGSPLNMNLNMMNGLNTYLAASQFMVQDNSNRHRRRGTNNILNPVQLLSLRKYDEQLTRKNNRRHSSYIGVKSRNFLVDIDVEYTENDHEVNEVANQPSNHQVNGHAKDIFKLDIERIKESSNNISKEDQSNKRQSFDLKHDQTTNNKEVNGHDQVLASQGSQNRINHVFYDENNKFSLESPCAQNTDYSQFNTNRKSENDLKQTNRYLDSNRFELLQTEERTQNDDYKISLNLFDQQTNNASRFLKSSPNYKDSSAFNPFQRENLLTEDELIGEGQNFKLNTLDSYQSEYIKTPVKGSIFSPFQALKK